MSRPIPPPRGAFSHWLAIPTRWMDNDVYGHVNNVVYYSFFDTVVNEFLIRNAGLDPVNSPVIGVVVETSCQFLRELSFPETIEAAMRVERIGASSVVYEIALFQSTYATAAAFGRFVHVYIDRASRRPTPLSDQVRAALTPLLIPR